MTALKPTPLDNARSQDDPSGPSTDRSERDRSEQLDLARLSPREIAAELARRSRSDRPAAARDPQGETDQGAFRAMDQARGGSHGDQRVDPAALSAAERQRLKAAYVEERYRTDEAEQRRARAAELRQSLAFGRVAGGAAAQPRSAGASSSPARSADAAPEQQRMPTGQHTPPEQPRNPFAAERNFVQPPQPGDRAPLSYDDPACPQPAYPDEPAEADEAALLNPAQLDPVAMVMPQPGSRLLPPEAHQPDPQAVPLHDTPQPHVLSVFDLPEQPTVLLPETPPSRPQPPSQPLAEEHWPQPGEFNPSPAPSPSSAGDARRNAPQLEPASPPPPKGSGLTAADLGTDPRDENPRDKDLGDKDLGDEDLRWSGRRGRDLRVPDEAIRPAYLDSSYAGSAYSEKRTRSRGGAWRNGVAAAAILLALAAGPALFYAPWLSHHWSEVQNQVRAEINGLVESVSYSDAAPAATPAANPVAATTPATTPDSSTAAATTAAKPSTAPAVAMEPLSASAAAPGLATAAPAVSAAIPDMAHKTAARQTAPLQPNTTQPNTTQPSTEQPSATQAGTATTAKPDSITDLITAAGATTAAPTPAATAPEVKSAATAQKPAAEVLTTHPATTGQGGGQLDSQSTAAATKVKPVKASNAWMKAQPYDPDNTSTYTPTESAGEADGAVIYGGTPDAWLKRQPYNPHVLTPPAQ